MSDKHKSKNWLSNILIFFGLIIGGYFRGRLLLIKPTWARGLSNHELHVLFIFGVILVASGLWLRYW